MAKRDYYEVLGVTRECDEKELKSAFRRLAMQFHPDRNNGDKLAEAKFKEASEAYERLKDPQARAAYDRFGHAAFEGGAGNGPAGGFDGNFGNAFSDIFDEFFGDFMGGGRRRRASAGRGSDLRYNMEITLEEAYRGKTDEIAVPKSVTCEECSGSGGKEGSEPVACQTCGGSGKLRASQGFFTIERTCVTCHGRGQVISDPCTTCRGQGRVTRERVLSVEIPAGVEDGTRIRLTGEGEAGLRGGPPGDLYIFLSVAPHEVFQRDSADIFCRIPISVAKAALGGHVEVPTVDGGRTRVSIPEGTQSGRQFRLRGKGMPVLRQGRFGDMYLQVTVETPVNLTRRQRELLAEFEQASNERTNPESHGFFAKVKEFWDGLSE
jgi:molecular chaperone DnaJ